MDSPPATAGNDNQEIWDVEIHHEFNPRWPTPGPWFAERIIGEGFVRPVANKTLKRMKEVLEKSP